jgi:bifunctional DNA-binding transcriptional regulator/antitoxin component of YhaV-PrlF toxin-antitoxin module
MVIPRSVREKAGLSEGTLMKVAVGRGGQVVLTPQIAVDRNGAGGRKNRKQVLRELAQTVAELRQEAKEKGIDKMSMKEIRAAVDVMREDLKREARERSAR